MTVPITNLLSRIFSAIPISALGVYEITHGAMHHLPGFVALGLGMISFGVFAFMQPLVFRAPLRALVAASQELAIGPQALRTALSMLGLALTMLGLVLRAFRI